MDVPILEKSLIYILRNPTLVYPSNHADANRRDAAVQFKKLQVGVWVGRRPQDDPGRSLAITIEKQGGVTGSNIDSFPATRRPLIDFTVWGRVGPEHEGLGDLLLAGELMLILLDGLQGTFESVQLCINRDGDPIQSDDAPRDSTDKWISSYTYGFLIPYTQTTASNRTG